MDSAYKTIAKIIWLNYELNYIPTDHWHDWTHCGLVTPYDVKKIDIGSGNVLSPVWCQVSSWANADLLVMGPLHGNKFQCNLTQNTKILTQEISFEIVVYKMTATLFRHLRFNWNTSLPLLLIDIDSIKTLFIIARCDVCWGYFC